MASSSSQGVDRVGLLASISSKMTSGDLEGLHERFDIPEEFGMSVPDKGAPVTAHGEDVAPLYLAHLEYGLRLPLPSFVRSVCGRLGVSPMQLAPNAIAILMAFLVICYRVGVRPTLQLFSNLVSVKTTKRDAHYYFVSSGARLVNFPESNKDWKEKFVWVFGADGMLACRNWPEIKKEALKPIALSPDEGKDLERVRGYAGSRDIGNLFHAASIRAAGLSFRLATRADMEQACILADGSTLPAEPVPKLPQKAGLATAEPPKTAATRPLKRVRGVLARQDVVALEEQADEIALHFTKSAATDEDDRGEKKRRLSASTAEEVAKAGEVFSDFGFGEQLPPLPQEEVPIVDLGSPNRSGEGPLVEEPEEGDRVEASEPIHRPGKEPVGEVVHGATETSAEVPIPVAEPEPGAGQGTIRWGDGLFPHSVAEFSIAEWERLHLLLIGNQEDSPSYKEEAAGRPLDREASILGSHASLMRATGQFTLPRDSDLLRKLPSAGIHQALQSYLIRGALLEKEMFSRLTLQRGLIDSFEMEVAGERRARAEAERKLAALAAEKESADGRWRREVETREKMLEGLRRHRSKISADLLASEDRNSRLEDEVDYLKTVLSRREGRVKFLEEEVEVEKRHRVAAQESSWADRRALSDLQLDLSEERAALERLRADFRAMEHRLAVLESKEGKAEVIEAYRQSALGKVELALAVKAGFDYAVARLPLEFLTQVEVSYPSRVAVCLSLLKDIEGRGGRINLQVEEDEEEGADEGQSSAAAAVVADPPPEAEPSEPTDPQAPLP